MQHEAETLELVAERALEALRWCWEAAYEVFIDETTGLWCARRLDGLGTIEGSGPDRLRIEIFDDWTLRPVVPR